MKHNEDFINMSDRIGKNQLLVQGPGGNTSIKNRKGIMDIKASGKWLSNSKKEDIFVSVDLVKIRSHIEKQKIDLFKDVSMTNCRLRPSIETTLHALMPHKVVLHTHPIELLSWLVCKNVKDQLTNEVLSGFSCAWVPYARPGEELTLAVQKALKEKSADIILLESHGLVVGGENCASTYSLMMQVLNRCHSKDKYNIHEVNSKNITLSKELNVRLPIYDEVHALALNDKLFEYCNDGTGVLYPDQAVFLGKKILCYQGNINDHNFLFFMKNHKSSSFVIVKGYGVLVSKDSKNDVDIMLRCHVRILSRLPENYNLNYLKESDIDRLLDWEPEKYRVRLDN